jgi:predicted TIM-barrel fold metal-dependent hydrolase
VGAVSQLPLVDHHCHGVSLDPLDRDAFEALVSEAAGPGRWHGSLLDSQVGLALRRVCAPLLGLEPHVSVDDYLARRAELGPDDANRRLMSSTGITYLLVDDGDLGVAVSTPDQLAGLTGDATVARRVVRLEAMAEQVVATASPHEFADAFGTALADAAAAGAVGVKSVAAYRVGLDLDPARPTAAEVADAAGRWQETAPGGGPARLTDPVLTRFVVRAGLDVRLPLQLHVGYGDADLDLHRSDPSLLTPLLRATAGLGVPVMLLHNYPFHRSAGYLAQVFDHVFVDIGLAVHGVGTRAREVLAELLELAPFGSVLFSSDAYGLAEHFAVAAAGFRDALGHLLDGGVADGSWSAADAERLARMVTRENARRAYRLDA